MARVKIRKEWTRKLPVVPLLSTRNWRVMMSEHTADPVFIFMLERNRVIRRKDGSFWGSWLDKCEADAQQVRERFFRAKTPEQALTFFQDFGPYHVNEFWGKQAGQISFSKLTAQRRFYEDALVDKKYWNKPLKDKDAEPAWMFLRQNLKLELRLQPPILVAPCKDVAECLRSTVFLDHLSGETWLRCANPECKEPPFKCTKSTKKYHSEACAALYRKWKQRGKLPRENF
jgi:hypothetical protein